MQDVKIGTNAPHAMEILQHENPVHKNAQNNKKSYKCRLFYIILMDGYAS